MPKPSAVTESPSTLSGLSSSIPMNQIVETTPIQIVE